MGWCKNVVCQDWNLRQMRGAIAQWCKDAYLWVLNMFTNEMVNTKMVSSHYHVILFI